MSSSPAVGEAEVMCQVSQVEGSNLELLIPAGNNLLLWTWNATSVPGQKVQICLEAETLHWC